VTDLDFLEYVYKSQLSKDYLPQSAEKLPGRERKQLITFKKKRGGGGCRKEEEVQGSYNAIRRATMAFRIFLKVLQYITISILKKKLTSLNNK